MTIALYLMLISSESVSSSFVLSFTYLFSTVVLGARGAIHNDDNDDNDDNDNEDD